MVLLVIQLQFGKHSSNPEIPTNQSGEGSNQNNFFFNNTNGQYQILNNFLSFLHINDTTEIKW